MKVISSALAPVYASAGSTLVQCLRVTRKDGIALGFTNCDRPVTVSGVVYHPGFEPSEMVSTSGLAVDNLEVKILPDDTTVTQADLLAGLWNNARFSIFETDFKNPTEINALKGGTTGEAQFLRGSWTIELRSLKQALQQQLGEVTTKTCRYRLGDSRCKVDLSLWTFVYTITAVDAVDPRRRFTCAASAEAADFYKEGACTMNTGASAGYSQKVKAFAGGVFTLALSMPFNVAVGDAITVVAGDQKRLLEDCKMKFNNVLNFGGEPHLPGQDLLMADPTHGAK